MNPQKSTRAANILHKTVGGFLIGASALLLLNTASMFFNIGYRANKAAKARELQGREGVVPGEDQKLPKLI